MVITLIRLPPTQKLPPMLLRPKAGNLDSGQVQPSAVLALTFGIVPGAHHRHMDRPLMTGNVKEAGRYLGSVAGPRRRFIMTEGKGLHPWDPSDAAQV
jgi:hypothetical protein